MTTEHAPGNIGNGSPAPRRDRSSDLSENARHAAIAALPRRKSSPRVKGFDYVGRYCHHVTFVTAERQPFFTQTKLAELATNEVQRIASANSFTVLAHCVMPDHVHVLIAGDSETSSLSSFAHRFKQSLGFKFKQETGNNLWQRSYHDHVLRTDEPWLPHAEYILNNPVRAGLVHTAQDWPYSGPRDAFRENGQV